MPNDTDKVGTFDNLAPHERRKIIATMCFEKGGRVDADTVAKTFNISRSSAYNDLQSDEVKRAVAQQVREAAGVNGICAAWEVIINTLHYGKPDAKLRAAMYIIDKCGVFADTDSAGALLKDFQNSLINNRNKEKLNDREEEDTGRPGEAGEVLGG